MTPASEKFLASIRNDDADIRYAAWSHAGEADPDEDPDDERHEDGRERRDVVAEVEHGYKSAAVWQRAWSRASAFCGSERLRPISTGPSTPSNSPSRLFSGRQTSVLRHRQVQGFETLERFRVVSTDDRPFPLQVDGDYVGECMEAEYEAAPLSLSVVS